MKPRGFSPLTACQIVKKVVTKPRANRGAVPSKSNRIAHKVIFSSIRAPQQTRLLFDSPDSPAYIAEENHLNRPRESEGDSASGFRGSQRHLRNPSAFDRNPKNFVEKSSFVRADCTLNNCKDATPLRLIRSQVLVRTSPG